MFVFYLWQRLWVGLSEMAIWREAYFRDAWQDFFDLFNSMPIAAVLALAARAARREGVALFFASMLVHQLVDLPLHVEDAHRHFFPFTDWRFASPVSYWDPAHYGAWGALLESVLVVVCCGVLRQRAARAWQRVALAGYATLQVLGWVLFYAVR